jgi:hypothetical protein
MERATAALDPVAVVVSLTMADSLERALRWTRDSRWAHPTPAVWWGGPAVASNPGRAAGLPGKLLDGGVDDGAASVDATLRGT